MDYYQFASKRDFEIEQGRHRSQPQAPDPNDPPIKRIKFYLDKYKIKEALQIFFHNDTLDLLSKESDFMWEAIPMICARLRGLCQYRFRVFEGCERMLCCIAMDEHCNPKEVLVSLLAEINQSENQNDDNVFRAMIRPLESTLLRMSATPAREENFKWTLGVLMRHVKDIELPQEYNIDGEKRLSLPNDPSVKRFIEVLPLMLSFIEEFNDKPADFDRSPMPVLTESQIDEVLNGELVDDGEFMNDDHVPTRCDIAEASITAIFQLIQRPLTFLDTTNYCKELRVTGIRALALLIRLLPDLFAPIYKHPAVTNGCCLTIPTQTSTTIDTTSSTQDDQQQQKHQQMQQQTSTNDGQIEITSPSITSLAANHFDANHVDAMLTLATCAYLFRCEVKPSTNPPLFATSKTSSPQSLNPNVPALDVAQSFPQILTHESLLYCHLPYVVALLKRPEILAHEKGLSLLGSLLSLHEPHSLGDRFFDLSKTSKLMEHLIQMMVYSPLCSNRRRAYELFTELSDLLTFKCKLEMFNWILQQTDLRPCIRAACVDLYRKQLNSVHKELQKLNQQSLMEGDVIRQINIWRTRYKLIGGQALVNFLDRCISACLPESQHIDIIENYELLLATLTMFRYLKLRKIIVKDDTEQDYLVTDKLKKSFFDPVRSAITLVMSELKLHTSNKDDIECLNYVMCRLDLVESVLVRTCDLYDC